MTNEKSVDEFERFPLRYAYLFLNEKGFNDKAEEVKNSRDIYKSYTSTLRRAKLVNFMEEHKLIDEFTEKYWPAGKTDKGQNQLKGLRRLYKSYSNSEEIEDDETEEETEGNSFDYEEDLKNYLINNLSVIEPGLKLFHDENGREGVEYPVDPNNKQVDILAIDKNSTLVVIELKVSRGYERVIGQCLYYKNRIKKLFPTKRVKIIIIAREITQNLKTATEELPDVELFEYKLSVKLDPIH